MRTAALVCLGVAWLGVVAAPSLRAEFLQPVAVQASNGEATQDALINGLGLDNPGVGTAEALHSRDVAETWSVIGSIKADVVFDLGQTVDLTRVYVWNYNVADGTDVGMKDVEVLVSPDTDPASANFTAIARLSLLEGGEAAQAFDVVGTTVRLVKLRGLSNWGHGWSVGLAEVRFESGEITGEVPAVVINNPHEGDVIPSGTDVTLDARVTDRDTNLLKVEFFDGEVRLGEKTASPYTFVVPTPALGDHAFRVVATDRTDKIGWATVNCSVRELVADRIEQIDDTENEGEALGQIAYTGTWNLAQGNPNDPRFKNNDHYSDVRNAWFEVRFRGVKVDVFGTVASHHGSGIATIDGGTEYTVSYKAPQRREQALVWSSPILPNREHVLRIRVSGNGVVTADRFDIHVSDHPDEDRATIQKVTATFTNLVVEVVDGGTNIVNPATVHLLVDQAAAPAQVVKSGATTTITHAPAAPFPPGSTHSLKVEADDLNGGPLNLESSFTLPSPHFPLAGLDGPFSTAGNWGLRQIWDAGRADALVSAAGIAAQAGQAGFAGRIHDTAVPVINLAKSANPGPGGLFFDDLPLPAEAEGLSEGDFVLVARATVRIPRAGDWTIGVHSDEGFALRFHGAPFASVHGNGERDENFPRYMVFQTNTGDSNTRGILRGLAAGDYEIEFLGWERVGAAWYEVYAAEGAFEDDTLTDQWFLIGAPGGLEIVASGPRLDTTGITLSLNAITIDFVSPEPDRVHQVEDTAAFAAWTAVAGATFQKTGAYSLRATINGVSGDARFYRVVLPAAAP